MNGENIDQDFERKSLISASPLRSAAVPFIETATIHFIIEAVDPLILPPYKGSTFRGGFGSALRRISCKTGAEDCCGCGSALSCDYSYIFNTPPPPGSARMKKAEAAPHPFVIEPPLDEKQFYHPGDRLAFSVILIGPGIDLAGIFLEAIEVMGENGLGKKKNSRGRMCIISVMNSKKQTIEDFRTPLTRLIKRSLPLYLGDSMFIPNGPTTDFSLTFLTPARFCVDKRPIPPREFDFSVFFRHLIRRLSLIGYFHGDGAEWDWNAQEIIERANPVRIIKNDLGWFDWERFSSPQDKRMALGGLVGNIVFSGNSAPFLPLLRAGEVLHVGKNTTFGLGKYCIINSIGDRYGHST
jgi:hypothetical protein